jgi:hypothetical protein
MNKNVLIPLSLLDRIIDLLGYWNITNYDFSVQCEHGDVYEELQIKRHKLALRDVYSEIIKAPDEDSRHEARIRYLRQKRWVQDLEEGIPF